MENMNTEIYFLLFFYCGDDCLIQFGLILAFHKEGRNLLLLFPTLMFALFQFD